MTDKTDPRHPELGPIGPEFDTPEQEIEHLKLTIANLIKDLENERTRKADKTLVAYIEWLENTRWLGWVVAAALAVYLVARAFFGL